jgi:sec-independent protein translocase protein TatB
VNFSPEKLFLVGIIALLVLGPNRLPQAARTLGKLLADFRRVSASLQSEVTAAIGEPRDALNQAVGEFGIGDLRNSIRSTITDAVTGAPARPAAPTNSVNGAVGAPIVDPSIPLDVTAHEAPASNGATNGASTDATPSEAPVNRTIPLSPDDPSLN